ncbi:unnamed protein product, partial [Amoebophrya sp. A25]
VEKSHSLRLLGLGADEVEQPDYRKVLQLANAFTAEKSKIRALMWNLDDAYFPETVPTSLSDEEENAICVDVLNKAWEEEDKLQERKSTHFATTGQFVSPGLSGRFAEAQKRRQQDREDYRAQGALENLQTCQQVLYDLTLNSLAPLQLEEEGR